MKASEYKIQRYRQDEDPWGFFLMKEDPSGQWVKWEDVEPLLRDHFVFVSGRNEDLRIKKLEVIK